MPCDPSYNIYNLQLIFIGSPMISDIKLIYDVCSLTSDTNDGVNTGNSL